MATRKAADARPKKGRTMTTEAEELMTTTFRITRAQWDALRREATQRALESEIGDRRPDASKLVREAIDQWLEKRR